MATNNRISVNDLDFEGIKQNLRNFLAGQSEFNSFNFEGSALSMLIDVLAYNTHYNALYDNMTINEMFLDTASKRSSVVSRAKELGYLPTSAQGAIATVDVSIGVSDVGYQNTTWAIPKGTPFTGQANDGGTYTYRTIEDYTAPYSSVTQSFDFTGIKLYEGKPLSFTWTADANSHYVIPNPAVDLRTLTVLIKEDPALGEFVPYVKDDNIINLLPDSRVYFLSEGLNFLYEIEFGNGVIGKSIPNGAIIRVDYMVTKGAAGNGAKTFSFGGSLPNNGIANISTTSPAEGGSDVESIESIKFIAPKYSATQNRIVTSDDFEATILAKFGNANSVSVWGGQENNPPAYGKVFISVFPKTGGTKLTDAEKSEILGILRPKKMMTVQPEIVDMDPLFLNMEAVVLFKPLETSFTASDIASAARVNILSYNNSQLKGFNKIYRESALVSDLLTIDTSIKSVNVFLHGEKLAVYYPNAPFAYSVSCHNQLYRSGFPESSVKTNLFFLNNDSTTQYFITDDGQGVLQLFTFASGVKTLANSNVGSLDYETGTVITTPIMITGTADNSSHLRFKFKMRRKDIYSRNITCVAINEETLAVTVLEDNPTSSSYVSSKIL